MHIRVICRKLLKFLLMVGNSTYFCSLEKSLLAEAQSAKKFAGIIVKGLLSISSIYFILFIFVCGFPNRELNP